MQQQRRLPLGVLALVPIVAGFALVAFTWPRQSADRASQTPAAGSPSATPPSRPGLLPTATLADIPPFSPPPFSPPPADGAPAGVPTIAPVPTPVLEHGAFHDGAWVRIATGDGDCLNARNAPSLANDYAFVNECIPDGSEGVIAGPPIEQEGHWWWRYAGSGWVVEDYLQYAGEFDGLGPLPPGASGTIAWVRDDAIRTLDLATGDEAAIVTLERAGDPLYAGAGGYVIAPSDLQWSPDGSMLSYTVARQPDTLSEQGWPVDLHIVRRDGTLVRVLADAAGRGWSPDSARIGVVLGAHQQQMGGGWNGVPALLDVATGDLVRLDAESFYQQDPPAFNHDGSLILIHRSDTVTADDGSVTSVPSFVIADLAGNVVARITTPAKTYNGPPQWSPVANRLAYYETSYGEGQTAAESYVVYDVDAGAVVGRAPIPARSQYAGGRCGGSGDMYRASWSPDGATLVYAAMFGGSGMNGAWAWDVATGATRLVRAPDVIAPAAAGDGLIAFPSDGYIFLGDPATGARTVLAKGITPAWSPR